MIQQPTFQHTSAALGAALFDLDGTLVDSERSWLDAIRAALVATTGEAADELVATFEGVAVDEAGRRLVEEHGHEGTPATVARLLEEGAIAAFDGQLRWLAGAAETLHRLRVAGMPLGLVTSSTREWVTAVDGLTGLGAFDTVVTADDVPKTKPEPAPYLRAARALGVHPARCVAFEDSEVGIRSARSAGCTVVRVGTPRPDLDRLADATIASLEGITTDWITALPPHHRPTDSIRLTPIHTHSL
ncbi:HAD family hydrolase [Leucobacter albus]|uniref:HAD family hydrolase n=1 Tax=Leucobacter albus TaxID=272210 RepID=A0ABW3TQT6_9MICO